MPQSNARKALTVAIVAVYGSAAYKPILVPKITNIVGQLDRKLFGNGELTRMVVVEKALDHIRSRLTAEGHPLPARAMNDSQKTALRNAVIALCDLLVPEVAPSPVVVPELSARAA